MDEQALIAKAREGDIDAFNQIVLAYQDLAYNVAYRVMGNPDGAMDATQDAFLRAFRALASFRGGSFKAWMLRIVTNCCYDMLRKKQRRPQTPLDDLVEDTEHSTLLMDEKVEDPEAYVMRGDLNLLIQRGLRELPDDQRAVLVMSDIEGLSYAEIAQVTSVSLGTVKSRLSRGRAKMRDFFSLHKEQMPAGMRLFDE